MPGEQERFHGQFADKKRTFSALFPCENGDYLFRGEKKEMFALFPWEKGRNLPPSCNL